MGVLTVLQTIGFGSHCLPPHSETIFALTRQFLRLDNKKRAANEHNLFS